MVGLPNPNAGDLLDNLQTLVADRSGFPVIPVAWFKFDGPVAASMDDAPVAATADASVMLIDVDPDSPERGRLLPVAARTLNPDDYVPDNTLALAPWPGIILDANRTYAFVVRRDYGDASGGELGVPEALWDSAHGKVPDVSGGDDIHVVYQPLWETLEQVGVDVTTVAAATVFTTDDVVAELADLVEAVDERHEATITSLAIDPTDGASHDGFCELHAWVTFPEFPQGTPPYNTQGTFEFGADGVPVPQNDVTVPLVIAIPRTEMPADGYPYVHYIHGSGGLSTQIVDRGPYPGPGQPPAAGQGPAYVLAKHGFASASHAMPVNPERVPGASAIAYINFLNLAAFRDLFRQGVLELALIATALGKLEIAPAVLEQCTGATLPAGADSFRINIDPLLVMGQSMGGMYTNMWGATDKRVKAVAPTGAGGFWSYMILITSLLNAPPLLAPVLGTEVENLTFLHPGMHLLQAGWEGAEPYIYMPRVGRRPLAGHPVRPVYEPAGQGDSYFPTALYDAYALAYGHQQAGDQVWASMQESLALEGFDGIIGYPVVNNAIAADGTAYTGAVVQYPGDGFTDPHSIFAQYPEVMHQYGCFFESFRDTGTATIVAPIKQVGPPCDLP